MYFFNFIQLYPDEVMMKIYIKQILKISFRKYDVEKQILQCKIIEQILRMKYYVYATFMHA